ncbi:MAG: hypothetical protein KAI47_02720 [Deltaproteobacteria bacterium]|nr:hypothetical protein [Deltaproteobacteria bacterium]
MHGIETRVADGITLHIGPGALADAVYGVGPTYRGVRVERRVAGNVGIRRRSCGGVVATTARAQRQTGTKGSRDQHLAAEPSRLRFDLSKHGG